MTHEEIKELANEVLQDAHPDTLHAECSLAEACLQLLEEGRELAEAGNMALDEMIKLANRTLEEGRMKGPEALRKALAKWEEAP